MADIGGSVEDYIAKKLHLNEQNKKEQVRLVLEYFVSIINGDIKSTPPELKGLFKLMIKKLIDDEEASMTTYILKNELSIVKFFQRNFQRFNYYEFKPELLVLRGEIPFQEFKVPVNDQRNFDRIEPFNVSAYAEMLENNPLEVEQKRVETVKINLPVLKQKQKELNNSFDEKIEALRQKLVQSINRGFFSREILVKKIKEVEESCIPALQIKYNMTAIEALDKLLTGETTAAELKASKIFDELNMSMISREMFYRQLAKKIK